MTVNKSGSFLQKFSWVSIFQLINSASAFLINIFVARFIGPSDFGNFYFFVSTAIISTLLFDFGLSRTLLRYSAHHEARGEIQEKLGYYTAVLKLKTLLGVSILILGIGAGWIWGGPLKTEIILGLITGIIISYSQFFAAVAQTEENYLAYNTILSFNTIRLLGIAGLVLIGMITLKNLYVIFVCAPILLAFLPAFRLGQDLAHAQKVPETHFYKTIINFGKWLIVLSLLETMVQRLDVILVRWLLDATQAGYYAGALAFFGIVYMLPSYSAVLVYPKIVKAISKKNEVAVDYFYKFSTDLMAIIAIPMALGLYAIAPDLIQNVIGEKFQASQPLFVYMAIYSMLFGCHLNTGSVFFAKDKPNWVVLIVAITFIVNLIANIILIPRLGIMGGGIAICLATTASLILSWTILAKQFKLFPNFLHLISYFVVSLIMMVIIKLFPVQGWVMMIIKIIVAMASYVAMILIINRFVKNLIPKTRHELEGD